MPRLFSIRPALALKGRKFKGLRGWAGKPLHPPLTDFPIARLREEGVKPLELVATPERIRRHEGHVDVCIVVDDAVSRWGTMVVT